MRDVSARCRQLHNGKGRIDSRHHAAPRSHGTMYVDPAWNDAMSTLQPYTADPITRDDVAALGGATVVEFGANWCGICAAAQPAIRDAFRAHPAVRHLKIEDSQ